jgi:hypothetical protein
MSDYDAATRVDRDDCGFADADRNGRLTSARSEGGSGRGRQAASRVQTYRAGQDQPSRYAQSNATTDRINITWYGFHVDMQ